MRVLLLDVNCKFSSTGKIAYDLYTDINNSGNEAAICYGRGPLVEGENIYKFGLDWETKFHAILTRLTGFTGCFSPLSTRRLIRFLDDFRPDVVHIHELHAYFVNIAPVINYLKEKKIPVVWTFHCEFMYTGKCGLAYDCERFKTGCGNCPAVKKYPTSYLFDCTRKMFKQKKMLLEDLEFVVVTPSRWLAGRVAESFLKNKAIKVVHNGIETESIFYPRINESLINTYSLENKKIVLSVAPNIMTQQKGGRSVLELAQNFPDKNTIFVLVGADSTEIHSENVLLIQKTKNQIELAEWYSLADVFVICSTKENFPTTCIEAQCCGTQVCGFDVGGVKETAVIGKGNFCEYGDIDALAQIVERLLSDGKPKNLAEIARSEFSKTIMTQKYMELYKKVMSKKSGM